MPEPNLPQALLRALKPRTAQMLATLRRLVLAESPSLENVPADRCCRLLAQEWRRCGARVEILPQRHRGDRSEEHTSELQSRLHLVCRLLLEKKKKKKKTANCILLNRATYGH